MDCRIYDDAYRLATAAQSHYRERIYLTWSEIHTLAKSKQITWIRSAMRPS